MTPHEKAKDIYFAMLNAGRGFTSEFLAKLCAEIAVEEMITENSLSVLEKGSRYNYWKQVKKELKKL